jgi:hypothetical protein
MKKIWVKRKYIHYYQLQHKSGLEVYSVLATITEKKKSCVAKIKIGEIYHLNNMGWLFRNSKDFIQQSFKTVEEAKQFTEKVFKNEQKEERDDQNLSI